MKSTIQRFWYNFLERLGGRINRALNARENESKATDAGDKSIVNFFAMVLIKVINRAVMGAAFTVESDSEQAEALKELCSDLQENVYSIAGHMLGATPYAECWCVPSYVMINGENKLIHSYVGGDRVRITSVREDGKINECYIILDSYQDKRNVYLLCRKHSLDNNGNLNISYFVSDAEAKEINSEVVPQWTALTESDVTYPGANHIGFGRYKSPVQAFNNNTVYGVPLNYNCAVVEEQLKDAVEMIEFEMKSSKKMFFPDWSIVRKTDKDGNPLGMYQLSEHIFPIRKKAGENGSLIDEYCPTIRNSAYAEHLEGLLERYQSLMGVSELLTHKTTGATATEIKMLNVDNLSIEQKIKAEIRKGNIETLEADAIYLGIARDLWTYDEEYTDIYQDEQQMLKDYIDLYNTGALEIKDLVKYWFPTYSDEQIEEKVNAINAEKANGTQRSIEDMLNM